MPRASATSNAKRSSINIHGSGQSGLAPPKRQIRSHSPAAGATATADASSPDEQSTNAPNTKQNGHATKSATVNGTANGSAAKGGVKGGAGCVDEEKGGLAYGLDPGDSTASLSTSSHKSINMKPSNSNLSASMLADANRTILPSYPLVDSLTLLIILLQLPSTVLSAVYFVFSFVSMIPANFSLIASNGLPASNFSTLAALFSQGSVGGPSLSTIIVSDAIMLLLSVFLWPTTRGILIDMAQAVVADTLGAGGTSTASGTTRNVGVCALVVGANTIYNDRYRIGTSMGFDMEAPASNVAEPADTSPGTLRWAFAVHIVTHGLIKATRTWLLPKASPETPSQPKDPEAAVQPITDTTKAKKGKKQGQWVRDQQPLWAALASSIVHLKEVEKTTSTTKTDAKPFIIDNPSSDAPEVWITKIGANEIEFGSNYHPTSDDDVVQTIDTRFPFYVELNGIKWPQTMISKRSGGGIDDGSTMSEFYDENEWRAEIFGLTPTTEYDISFLRKNNGEVIYTTSACTSSKQANVDSALVKEIPKPSKPLSAITTLQHSLEAARNNLEDQKKRLKAAKRQNTKKTATLRNDIDNAKSRLGTGDKNDERARRRALSLRDSVRRADEDAEKFQVDLQKLETLPEDPEEEYRERRREWREEKDRLAESKKSAKHLLDDADRKITEVRAEISSAVSKREKAATKLNRIRTDLERIRAEAAAQEEEEGKARHREEEAIKRHNIEREFNASISKMEMDTMNYKNQARTNYSNLRTLETSMALQQQQLHAQVLQEREYQAQNMTSPRSIFGPGATNPISPIYGSQSFPPKFSPPSAANNNGFPPSMFYDHQRSTSMFSDITNISEIDAMGQRKRSSAEDVPIGSYVSDPFMPSYLAPNEEHHAFADQLNNNHLAFADRVNFNPHYAQPQSPQDERSMYDMHSGYPTGVEQYHHAQATQGKLHGYNIDSEEKGSQGSRSGSGSGSDGSGKTPSSSEEGA